MSWSSLDPIPWFDPEENLRSFDKAQGLVYGDIFTPETILCFTTSEELGEVDNLSQHEDIHHVYQDTVVLETLSAGGWGPLPFVPGPFSGAETS